MKLHAAMIAFIVLGFAGPVLADTMDSAYGNTVSVTGPDGATAHYFFEPDGTFTVSLPGGARASGVWEIRGEEICLLTPDIQDEESCSPYPGAKEVGDDWTLETGSGSVAFTISPGRS